MHTRQSELVRIVVWQSRQSHQTAPDRRVNSARKLGDQLADVGVCRTAAAVYERAFGIRNDVSCHSELGVSRVGLYRLGAPRLNVFDLAARPLHVLRYVNEHRSHASAPRDAEGLVQNLVQAVYVLGYVVVLGYRHCDVGYIQLLEAVATDLSGRDVSGNHYHRNRIEICRRDSGYKVCRARSGRCYNHPYLAGRASVSVGSVSRPLFVRGEYMLYFPPFFSQLLVYVEHLSARVAEHEVDSLLYKRVDRDFGAGHRPLPFRSCCSVRSHFFHIIYRNLVIYQKSPTAYCCQAIRKQIISLPKRLMRRQSSRKSAGISRRLVLAASLSVLSWRISGINRICL